MTDSLTRVTIDVAMSIPDTFILRTMPATDEDDITVHLLTINDLKALAEEAGFRLNNL